MKPRIKLTPHPRPWGWIWQCASDSRCGFGNSPREAYWNWTQPT